MMDDDVTNKKGIFEYVLTGNESKLSILEGVKHLIDTEIEKAS